MKVYLDISEVITDDLPTPTKYHSKPITVAYQRKKRDGNQTNWFVAREVTVSVS